MLTDLQMSADSVVTQELQALGILADFDMVCDVITSAPAKDLPSLELSGKWKDHYLYYL